MNAQDLNALGGQGAGDANRPRSAIGCLVAEYVTDESLARRPHHNWAAEFIEPPGVSQQFQIMLRSFAKADAGIETNSIRRNAGAQEHVATIAQKVENVADD